MLNGKWSVALFCSALALMFAASDAHADKRVALVIGNSSYQNTPALANPEHDAEDMVGALKGVGFEVIFERDLNKRGMEQAIARFARAALDSDAALFYYAGHGMQHRGLNYLMPIDAKLEDEFSLDFEMTRFEDVLRAIGRSRGVKILVLDACRRNPLAEKLATTNATRDFIATRGLARLDASRGMVLVYSTQADQVAVDGGDRNSPFTTALLKQIGEPGLEIGTLFRRVAADVNKATGGRQLPEVSISLLGEFYFNRADSDAQAWAKIRGSQDPAQLKQFISRYPNSPLVADVHERIESIERAQRARVERERLDQLERERLAQERLKLEQAQRELQARIDEERNRLAQQRAAQDQPKAAPDIQTANANPSPQPAATQPPLASPLVGSALVSEIKRQLTRVGCYAGPIDDKWTSAETTLSVEKFNKYASAPAPAREATADFLETIRAKAERVCPPECTNRQIEQDGRCIAKQTASRPRSKTPARTAKTAKLDPTAPVSNDARNRKRRVTPGGVVTCGPRGCQTVPKGCYAVRGAGGKGMGGKIICP